MIKTYSDLEWLKMADVEQLNKCYSNLTSVFVIIAGVSRGTSVISLLACLLVAATILLFKKYIFFTQRLVLYLCIAAGLYSIAIATGATVYFPMHTSSRGMYSRALCHINTLNMDLFSHHHLSVYLIL